MNDSTEVTSPRSAILHALIAVGHQITADEVRFFRDPSKGTTALSQLCDSLESAAATPPASSEPTGWHEAVEKLVEEWGLDRATVLSVFSTLLPHWMADPKREHVWIAASDLIRSDDYGVYGSTFYRCCLCEAESGAGVLNKGIPHKAGCPLHDDNCGKLIDTTALASTNREEARDAERMREALTAIVRMADAAKEPCGMDPESPAAIRNGKFASFAQVAAQGLGWMSGPALSTYGEGTPDPLACCCPPGYCHAPPGFPCSRTELAALNG